MTDTILLNTGRILLGLYFLLPGIMKFAAWDMHIDMMVATNIHAAGPHLMIAAIVEIIAGIMLIIGAHVRIMALGCALLVIVINVMMHDFWNFEGVAAAHETQNFIKNLGIFSGLLVLASASLKRKLALNNFWKPDVKIRADI